MTLARVVMLSVLIAAVLGVAGCPLVEDTRQPDGGADTP